MHRGVGYCVSKFGILLIIVTKALLPGEVDSEEEDGKRNIFIL